MIQKYIPKPIWERLEKYPGLLALVERFSKFASIGLIMTAATASANVILLKYFDTPLYQTYIIVNAISIFISYLLNSSFTFKSKVSTLKAIGYYAIYLSSMGLGVLLLHFYQWILPDVQKWVYPLLTIPITTVWNFTLSSKWMK